MKLKNGGFSKRQLLFKEMFVGTLIYVVVLGFFNDYTKLVYAKSFSSIFFTAILLEVLTYAVTRLEKYVIAWFNRREGKAYATFKIILAWLILFVSKFIFIWIIDLLFSEKVYVKGFVGILLVVVSVTVLHKLADYIFVKLGDED